MPMHAGMLCLLLWVWVLISASVQASNIALPQSWQAMSLGRVEWSVTSNPLLCRMEPSGENERVLNGFQQAAGESLAFFTPWQMFHAPEAALQKNEVGYGVWVLNPAWKTVKDAQWLGRAELHLEPYTAPSAASSPQLAQAMLRLLNQGRQLWVQPMDINSSVAQSGYLISNVGFRLAYREFERCLTQLVPKNFDQLEKIALLYEGKNKFLSSSQQGQLKEISRYVMVDPSVQGLYIDGHSDSKGLRGENLKVSETRALKVAEYLEMQGLRRDQMVVRWHGERYPVASNRTAAGRNKNNRVTVRMSQFPMVYPRRNEIESQQQPLAESDSFVVEPSAADGVQVAKKPAVTMGSSSSTSRLGSE